MEASTASDMPHPPVLAQGSKLLRHRELRRWTRIATARDLATFLRGSMGVSPKCVQYRFCCQRTRSDEPIDSCEEQTPMAPILPEF